MNNRATENSILKFLTVSSVSSDSIYIYIYTSGKKKLCITKKPIKDQYQNKIY